MHNYTLGDTENEALRVIRAFITDMMSSIGIQFGEDQSEVDGARDAVIQCKTDAIADKATAKRYKQTMEGSRREHKGCRRDEAYAASLKNRACRIYHQHRKGDLGVPPSCMGTDLEASDIASTDKVNRKVMEQCLRLTKAWLDPLYAKYIECDEKTTNTTNFRDQCNIDQGEFERSYCTFAFSKETACNNQIRCRNEKLAARNATHDAVSVSEAARKADYVTGKLIKCYFDVFEASNTDKPATLDTCAKLAVSTSQFDVVYHEVPAAAPCRPVDFQPDDREWISREYDNLPAAATVCTPCVQVR